MSMSPRPMMRNRQFSQNNATRLLPSRLPPVTPCWPVFDAAERPAALSMVLRLECQWIPCRAHSRINGKQRYSRPCAGPTAVKAWPAEPTRDPDDGGVSATISPQLIDVAAEESCPAPAVQLSAQNEAPRLAPALATAQAPSATTFELMSKLEALASDLAVKERASSETRIGTVHEEPKLSGELRAVEPSISVSPRPAGFESDQFASDKPSTRRRTVRTLAGCFTAALIELGVAFAWQSHSVWTATPPNDPDIAAVPPDPIPARQVPKSDVALQQSGPVTQTATAPAVPAATSAPASSPELVKQLEAMTQDLISVRRSLETLTAAQKQLEQLAAKQEQLAAKQDQMAQNIAKLQATEQSIRPKRSAVRPPPPQARAASVPPPAPPEPAAQLSSVPRSALHPVPPLPIPP